MGDRGNTFYAPSGETTEWEDILVKKGILAPKTKVPTAEEQEVAYQEPNAAQKRRERLWASEDLEAEEDDYDDDGEFERLRAKRMEALKRRARRNVFGGIKPISKAEWAREVNEASRKCWVVAYLYEPSHQACKLMDDVLRQLADKHRDIKVVSLQSTACIENWPARNLPTLFLYKNDQLKDQLLTLNRVGGLNMTLQHLEDYFASVGVFQPHDEDDDANAANDDEQE